MKKKLKRNLHKRFIFPKIKWKKECLHGPLLPFCLSAVVVWKSAGDGTLSTQTTKSNCNEIQIKISYKNTIWLQLTLNSRRRWAQRRLVGFSAAKLGKLPDAQHAKKQSRTIGRWLTTSGHRRSRLHASDYSSALMTKKRGKKVGQTWSWHSAEEKHLVYIVPSLELFIVSTHLGDYAFTAISWASFTRPATFLGECGAQRCTHHKSIIEPGSGWVYLHLKSRFSLFKLCYNRYESLAQLSCEVSCSDGGARVE